jgi:two-component system chemotaxis response regulator CheY
MAKVLVVDDSASMRQVICESLKEVGHDIQEAVDGQDGLSKAKSCSFDLVLTDVNMPNMDGIEMTKQIRTLAPYKFTPVLVITTESSGDKKSEGKAAGATGWIVKPFTPEKLIDTIKKVLG